MQTRNLAGYTIPFNLLFTNRELIITVNISNKNAITKHSSVKTRKDWRCLQKIIVRIKNARSSVIIKAATIIIDINRQPGFGYTFRKPFGRIA